MVERAIGRTRSGIGQALSPKIILPALALLTGVMYLGAAGGAAGLGFPLDDSWIHQTIARNIALHGEYTFNLHQPMSGSTAPLWTLMLAAGYFIPGGYLWFTYALGLLSLLLTAATVYQLANTFYPAQRVLPLVAAVFYVLEWRSGWSALSGMETPFFTLLCCLSFLLYTRGRRRPANWTWAASGLAAAAATFLRPEGLVLFLVLIAHSLWRAWRQQGSGKTRAGLMPGLVLAGFLVLTGAGYAVFNYQMSGTLLPTTFYAKSQYFLPNLNVEATIRYVVMAPWILFLGPLLALTPGIAYGMVMILRRIWLAASSHRTVKATVESQSDPSLDLVLLPAIWMVAVFGLYALRLPVAYHHGRYLMPLIPFLCIYGLHGTSNMLSGLHQVKMFKAATVWRILIAAAAVFLWIRGAGIYADEVKFIADEHLRTAAWLRENTEPYAKVATHDIGAIGYYSGREVVDIAGLITPEAIAYTRDENKLLQFVRRQGAEYMAIFPDWYPSLARSMKPNLIYRVQANYVVDAGFQNMSVYRVPEQ